MSLSSQIAVFLGGFILCFAIMLPIMTRWNNPVVPPPTQHHVHESSRPIPLDKTSKTDSTTTTKPSKRSWVVFFAPFYAVGVCAYVLYIVYRLMSKQRLKAKSASELSKSNMKRKHKMVLTRSELGALERKLTSSEKAVDEILNKARLVMTEVYQKGVEDKDESVVSSSDLDETSDDEGRRSKITELVTTSSANNDSHQDSSMNSDDPTSHHHQHHRKTHHRTKRHSSSMDPYNDCSSSSDWEQSPISPLPSSLPQFDEVSTVSTSGSTTDNSDYEDPPTLDTPAPSVENISSADPAACKAGDFLHSQPIEKVNSLQKSVGDFESAAAAAVGEFERPVESDSRKRQLLREKEELLQTTRQVVDAMEEIRYFIKEQKQEQ